jgi:hypothetical protein
MAPLAGSGFTRLGNPSFGAPSAFTLRSRFIGLSVGLR